MKLSRVLVVFKKSTLQLQAFEFKEQRFLKLLESGHQSVAKVSLAHEQHMETLSLLESELKKRNVDYKMVARADLDESEGKYDLIFSVGGDGTFLDASHSLLRTPILGINSALSSSFGHFCIANKNNLVAILDKLEKDELAAQRLLRLELTLNGKKLPELVLNEALIAHSNPAGTSRYLLEIDGQIDEQRSSGLWVGPPSGSTGALKSAGGAILPITATNFQYIVREPWERPGQTFQFSKGLLKRGQSIRLLSQMRTGAVYIDGNHIEYPFTLGDELSISASENDLIAFVDPNVNEIFVHA
ncbi:MAG: NAD(+)/NADH kinase [Candidatus Obscuribacterales bacterium]|nr:NAD(+)/NADH kinase [Candidatus Obscuribacterales bacterium]